MTNAFVYEEINYGEIICSPQALAATRQAKLNNVSIPEFLADMETHIKQHRPEWTIERLFDYAGPRTMVLLLGATEEEAEQWPIVSQNVLKGLTAND